MPFTILPMPLSKYLPACYINIYLRGSGSVERGRALAEATQLAGCKSGNRAQGFEMLGLFSPGDTLPDLIGKAEQKPEEACLHWAEDVSWWWNLMHNSCLTICALLLSRSSARPARCGIQQLFPPLVLLGPLAKSKCSICFLPF